VRTRKGVVRVLTRHSGSIEKLVGALDPLSGALLLLIGVSEFCRLVPS
jgi:MprA protease rhombosortase-interaction domain-containing protein